MRILHAAESYSPEICGVQGLAQNLSEALVRRSHDVTVATHFHPDRNYDQLNGVSIKQFDIRGSSLRGWRGQTDEYRRFVADFAPDILTVFYTRTWAMDLIGPRASPARSSRILLAGGISVIPNWKWRLYHRRLPSLISGFDHLVYHSKTDGDYEYGQRLTTKDYSIIGNGVLEREFDRPVYGFRRRHKINTRLMFLNVSNYGHGKNQETVIRAFRKANVPDSTLVLIGSAHNPYSRRLRSLAGDDRTDVRILAGLPRRDIVSAYHEADIFLSASLLECFPLVILEAMASGTPFVGTHVGCVGSLPGGVIISTREEMARTVRRLSSAPEERNRLAGAGRRAYETKYRWSRIVDSYEQLYLDLVEKNKRRRKLEHGLER